MSEAHHERSLAGILESIARSDATLEPPVEREARVMRAVRLPSQRRSVPIYGIVAVTAAALCLGLLLIRRADQAAPGLAAPTSRR
jgi:hypothetical protein